MSPLKRSTNLAARMGRWSAHHWKTAVFGWLAFVVAAFVIGNALGTSYLDENDTNVGEARKADRIISDAVSADEEAVERAIRPRRLGEYIGQTPVKTQLEIFISAARARGEALDHVLIFGPPATMVSNAGRSNPARRNAASISAATSASVRPAKTFESIHLATLESLCAPSRNRSTSQASFRTRSPSTTPSASCSPGRASPSTRSNRRR